VFCRRLQNAHNNRLLEKQKQQNKTPRKKCNCREKESCPLKGNCQECRVIYQAPVETTENEPATYIGLSEGPFKLRYANHRSSFKNKEKANQTELSKYIWQLTNKNIKHNISWKILRKAKPYNTITKRCNLCLRECFFILYKPNMCTLNKRNKLLSTCQHSKKFFLCNHKT